MIEEVMYYDLVDGQRERVKGSKFHVSKGNALLIERLNAQEIDMEMLQKDNVTLIEQVNHQARQMTKCLQQWSIEIVCLRDEVEELREREVVLVKQLEAESMERRRLEILNMQSRENYLALIEKVKQIIP